MSHAPKCIKCGSRRTVMTSGTTDRSFFCANCKIDFDPEDDGTTGYGDPSRIAARKEQHELQQASRRQNLGRRK